MNDRRRKENNINGMKKYLNFQNVLALIFIIGIIINIATRLTALPELKESVKMNTLKLNENRSKIALIEKDIQYIIEGIGDIKILLKE